MKPNSGDRGSITLIEMSIVAAFVTIAFVMGYMRMAGSDGTAESVVARDNCVQALDDASLGAGEAEDGGDPCTAQAPEDPGGIGGLNPGD